MVGLSFSLLGAAARPAWLSGGLVDDEVAVGTASEGRGITPWLVAGPDAGERGSTALGIGDGVTGGTGVEGGTAAGGWMADGGRLEPSPLIPAGLDSVTGAGAIGVGTVGVGGTSAETGFTSSSWNGNGPGGSEPDDGISAEAVTTGGCVGGVGVL